MPIQYRVCQDAAYLAGLRMAFILNEHPELGEADIAAMSKATFDYIAQALSEGRYLGFVGEIDGEAACTAGFLIYDLPPIDRPLPRRVGHVLNFFTFAQERRKGYGKGLMDFMIAEARKRGFDRLFLNATPDGYPLYLKCGFGEAECTALRLMLR